MNRLTRGYLSGNYATLDQKCDCAKSVELGFYNAVNKLGQLEDIEEELGIDFITLFKALKYGVYTEVNIETHHYGNGETITEKHFTHYYIDYINSNHQLVHYYYSLGDWEHEERLYKYFDFKDYGKTWVINKEDLENGK